MNKAILRIQKLKSPVAVRRSMKHAFREQDTPNADPNRTPDNTHIGAQNVTEAMQKFNAAMPEKVRKNGVLAVEYLFTGSPEAMKDKSPSQQNAYLMDSLKWLQDKHGAENVIYAGIHRDETTPHMYAYVIPKDEHGKLNCRAFFGAKDALSKMQTDFADRVGLKHGLERGIEGSKSRHTAIRDYYHRVNAATPQTPDFAVPDGKFLEGKKEYGKRVIQAVVDQITPELFALKAKAQQTDLAQQQAKTAEKGRQQAEVQLAQREKLIQTARDNANDSAEKLQKLIGIIVKGGDMLDQVQIGFRERTRLEQEKQKDQGLER
jgi:hypothetical protein